MLALTIKLDGDGCWPDLAEKLEGKLIEAEGLEVALLPVGMTSGKPSVCLRIELPDGTTVLAHTSLALFEAAAAAFRGRAAYLDELRAKGGKQS